MASAASPSTEPAPFMATGSRLSGLMGVRTVIVPPGWMLLVGAVDAVVVTWAMPLSRFATGAGDTFTVVAVELRLTEVAVDDRTVVAAVAASEVVVGIATVVNSPAA